MLKAFFALALFFNMIYVSASAINAKSAILIDAGSGRVLYEYNSREKLPMASTTKIMTGLLACESGKMNNAVKVSPFAVGTEGSSLWLKMGEVQTLENLVYGLMLKSGNDAAVAIAEHLGGNIDAFALLMNEKARKIGAVNTRFRNPHGLDADGHYTTAYDLALLAREAMKNKSFREIVSTKNYSIPMKDEKWDRALKNHNKLLWMYDGCNGIKTGFTKKSGRCLVTSAAKGDENFICVTLDDPDDWNDHTYLFNYGFDNFENFCVAKKGSLAKTVTYDKKYMLKVNLLFGENFNVAVDKDDKITTEIKTGKIKYPAEKGTVAGYTYVYCNGEEIGKVPLVTEEGLKKVSVLDKILFFIRKISLQK